MDHHSVQIIQVLANQKIYTPSSPPPHDPNKYSPSSSSFITSKQSKRQNQKTTTNILKTTNK